MIKTIIYCDICGKEIHKTFEHYYQLYLPAIDYNGEIGISEEKQDICKSCLKKLRWKISEIKYPDRKCPD